MAICKMKKLSLLASISDRDKISDALIWLGNIQISDPGKDGLIEKLNGLITPAKPEESDSTYLEETRLIEYALSQVGRYRKPKRGLFTPRKEMSKAEFIEIGRKRKESLEIAGRISDICENKRSLQAKLNQLELNESRLIPWKSLDVPLDFNGTNDTVAKKVIIPSVFDSETVISELENGGAIVENIGSDSEFFYLFFLCHATDYPDIHDLLNKYSFSLAEFEENETASQRLYGFQSQKAQLSRISDKLDDELKSLSSYCDDLEYTLDYISYLIDLSNIRKLTMQGDKFFALQGWLNISDTDRLEKSLENFEVYYELLDPEENENPPIKLKNKKLSKPFEAILEMYSYPDYRGIDPTFVMSIFYFIIFGFMLGDVIYGLLLSAGCLFLLKKMKPRGTLKSMFQLFAICGVSMMIAGAIMGSWLGDFPVLAAKSYFGKEIDSIALLFDPIKNPMVLLVISLGFGVLHIIAGLLMKFYMLWKRKEYFAAFFDIGSWIILFAGLGLLAAGGVVGIPICSEIGKWVSLVGVASLVLTQGRAEKNPIMKFLKGLLSLYDLVSYASDILSYSRILALGLSSAVVASVINTMAFMPGNSFIGIIFTIIILIFGHVVNLALNLLGTFVHTSRLQYIEFFGKFYEDGGDVFTPHSVNPKYIQIINN